MSGGGRIPAQPLPLLGAKCRSPGACAQLWALRPRHRGQEQVGHAGAFGTVQIKEAPLRAGLGDCDGRSVSWADSR